MKKYVFAGLVIEVTRRCNMRCKHCGRGEAQNVTITKEIIDRIFEDVQDCVTLYISGGEPLLEPDVLLYLLDKVKNWARLSSLEITTNGSILDERIICALEELCRSPIHPDFIDIGRKVALTISNDEYHVSGEMQKALDFYGPLFEEANQRLEGTGAKMKLSTWSPVNEEETRNRWNSPAALIYSGRAKDLVDDCIKRGMLIKIPPYNNHRLKITGDVVHCRIMVTSKGGVVVAEEDDAYDTYDANTVGNIMDKSLTDIIDTHQANCLISCNESNYIDQMNYLNLFRDHTTNPELVDIVEFKNVLLHEINFATLQLRKTLKKVYPLIPAQELIAGLPLVLGDDNLDVLVLRIISRTHWSIKEKLKNEVDELEAKYTPLINSDTAKAVRNYCEAISYMQDNGLSLIMKLRKAEMDLLIDRAKKYADGELEPENDAVFGCGDTGIFANENDVDAEYLMDRKMMDYFRAFDEFSKMR